MLRYKVVDHVRNLSVTVTMFGETARRRRELLHEVLPIYLRVECVSLCRSLIFMDVSSGCDDFVR